MSIKSLINKKKPEVSKYVGSLRRSAAAAIDMWIVLFMRVIVVQFLGVAWINPLILKFMEDFKNEFGTETVKNTPEHINFITHHGIFISVIMFYAIVIFIGAIYYAYCNSSAWQATVGKRLMKALMVREPEEKRITFGLGLWHYFLSILPFAFVIYLISFQLQHNLTFYQAVTVSELNLFLGIIFAVWVQIHVFTKNKATAYDMICKTVLINGRSGGRWPWSKS